MSLPQPHHSLQEPLYFLLNEVETHCQLVELFLTRSSAGVLPRIRGRQGYVRTLQEKLDLQCAQLLERRKPNTPFAQRITTLRQLGADLARMTQICFDGIADATLEQDYQHPATTSARKLIRRILRALDLIKVGLGEYPRRIGIKLGRRTQKLINLCNEVQETTLEHKQDTDNGVLLASVLINSALKRLVEQLAVVGESLIKTDLGHVATLDNYDHLRRSAATLNYDLDDLKVRRLALTRSGSAIAAISHKNSDGQQVLAVYKEGDHDKITEEVAGVNHWRGVDPTLAPDVLAQASPGDGQSSLLIEHIPGKTLETLLLEGNEAGVQQALKALFKTLERTWQATLTKERSQAKFMQQLAKRLPDSRRIHPEFFTPVLTICQHRCAGFEELMEQVARRESRWQAPFSVLIHGDFNVDNLIYDKSEKRIYFIDLHRSSYFDYVQDISVLMVSIYRLQTLAGRTRSLMMDAAQRIYRFAARFAKQQQDSFFEVRLAAGLARSFATSTRFIFDKKLASRMHLRSRYLLERLAALPSHDEETFKIPVKELYSE